MAPGACKPFKARCKSRNLTLRASEDREVPRSARLWEQSGGDGRGCLASLEPVCAAELEAEPGNGLCRSPRPWTKGALPPEHPLRVPQTDLMFQPMALEPETVKSRACVCNGNPAALLREHSWGCWKAGSWQRLTGGIAQTLRVLPLRLDF